MSSGEVSTDKTKNAGTKRTITRPRTNSSDGGNIRNTTSKHVQKEARRVSTSRVNPPETSPTRLPTTTSVRNTPRPRTHVHNDLNLGLPITGTKNPLDPRTTFLPEQHPRHCVPRLRRLLFHQRKMFLACD